MVIQDGPGQAFFACKTDVRLSSVKRGLVHMGISPNRRTPQMVAGEPQTHAAPYDAFGDMEGSLFVSPDTRHIPIQLLDGCAGEFWL